MGEQRKEKKEEEKRKEEKKGKGGKSTRRDLRRLNLNWSLEAPDKAGKCCLQMSRMRATIFASISSRLLVPRLENAK